VPLYLEKKNKATILAMLPDAERHNDNPKTSEVEPASQPHTPQFILINLFTFYMLQLKLLTGNSEHLHKTEDYNLLASGPGVFPFYPLKLLTSHRNHGRLSE
jgi:hypothetical protein